MNVDGARQPSVGLARQTTFSASMDSSSILHLGGELDLGSAPTLKAALDPLTRADGTITVDLAGVTFMDSSAVHVLLEFAHQAGTQRPVVLLGASPAARRVLELCGVSALFEHR